MLDLVRQDADHTRPQHLITMSAEEGHTEATVVVAKPAHHTVTVIEALVASTTMREHRAIVHPPDDRWRSTRRLEDAMKSLTAAITRHLPTLMQTVPDLRMIGHQENSLQGSQRTLEREGMRVTTSVAGATGKFYSLFHLSLSEPTSHSFYFLPPLPPVFYVSLIYTLALLAELALTNGDR